VKTLVLGAALTAATLALAPVAHADMPLGNYELQIGQRGSDFHTWVWWVTPCDAGPAGFTSACREVHGIPRPIAGATDYDGDAQLANGRYTLTLDLPDGLRCNGYWGYTIPTHDVYSWDAVTLAGSVDSTSDTGCDGAPGGTNTYPFSLSRM
jgi:hypothetical protein